MSTLRRTHPLNDENAAANRFPSSIVSGTGANKKAPRSSEKKKKQNKKQPLRVSESQSLDDSSSTVMSLGSLLNDSSLLLDLPQRERESAVEEDASPFTSKKTSTAVSTTAAAHTGKEKEREKEKEKEKERGRRETFTGGSDVLNALLYDLDQEQHTSSHTSAAAPTAAVHTTTTAAAAAGHKQHEKERGNGARRETLDGHMMDALLDDNDVSASVSEAHLLFGLGHASPTHTGAPRRKSFGAAASRLSVQRVNDFLDLDLSLDRDRDRDREKDFALAIDTPTAALKKAKKSGKRRESGTESAKKEKSEKSKKDKERRETIDAACMDDLLNALDDEEEQVQESKKDKSKKDKERRETIDAACMDDLLNALDEEEDLTTQTRSLPISSVPVTVPAVAVSSTQPPAALTRTDREKEKEKKKNDRRTTLDAACLEDLLNDLDAVEDQAPQPQVKENKNEKSKKDKERRETIDAACMDDLLDALDEEEEQIEEIKKEKTKKDKERRETIDAACMDDLLNALDDEEDNKAATLPVSLSLSPPSVPSFSTNAKVVPTNNAAVARGRERETSAHVVSPPTEEEADVGDNASINTMALLGDVQALLENEKEKDNERERDMDVSEISALSDCTFATAKTSLSFSLDFNAIPRASSPSPSPPSQRVAEREQTKAKENNVKDSKERDRRETIDTHDLLSLSFSLDAGHDDEASLALPVQSTRERELNMSVDSANASLDTLALLQTVADSLEQSTPISEKKKSKRSKQESSEKKKDKKKSKDGSSSKKEKKRARDSLSLAKDRRSLRETERDSFADDNSINNSINADNDDDNASINTFALLDSVREAIAEEERNTNNNGDYLSEEEESLIALEDLLRRGEREEERESLTSQTQTETERVAGLKRKIVPSSPAPVISALPANKSFSLPIAPSSALKSCLSAKKKRPRNDSLSFAQGHSVVFGSPEVAEFRKTSPSCSFTPLDRKTAKQMFTLPPLALEPTEEEEVEKDVVTEENERILEEWDRLTNASEVSDGEEDRDSERDLLPLSAPRSRSRSASASQQCRSFESEAQQFFDEFVASSLSPIAEREGERDDSLSVVSDDSGKREKKEKKHKKEKKDKENKRRRRRSSSSGLAGEEEEQAPTPTHAAESEGRDAEEEERERALVRSARRRRSKLMPRLDLSEENDTQQSDVRESDERERSCERNLFSESEGDFGDDSVLCDGPTVTVTVALPQSLAELMQDDEVNRALSHKTHTNTLQSTRAHTLEDDLAQGPFSRTHSTNTNTEEAEMSLIADHSTLSLNASRTVEIETDLHALLENLEKQTHNAHAHAHTHTHVLSPQTTHSSPSKSLLSHLQQDDVNERVCEREDSEWSLVHTFPQSDPLSPALSVDSTPHNAHTEVQSESMHEGESERERSVIEEDLQRLIPSHEASLLMETERDTERDVWEHSVERYGETEKETERETEREEELSFVDTKRRMLLNSDSFLSSPIHNTQESANEDLSVAQHNASTQHTSALNTSVSLRGRAKERESLLLPVTVSVRARERDRDTSSVSVWDEADTSLVRENSVSATTNALRDRLKALNSESRSHTLALCRTPGVPAKTRAQSLSSANTQAQTQAPTNNTLAALSQQPQSSVALTALSSHKSSRALRERQSLAGERVLRERETRENESNRRASLSHIASTQAPLPQPQSGSVVRRGRERHSLSALRESVIEREALSTFSLSSQCTLPQPLIALSQESEANTLSQREAVLETVCEEVESESECERETQAQSHTNVLTATEKQSIVLSEHLSRLHATATALHARALRVASSERLTQTVRAVLFETLSLATRSTALSHFGEDTLKELCESALSERDVSVFTQRVLQFSESERVLSALCERERVSERENDWHVMWVDLCSQALRELRSTVLSHNTHTQTKSTDSVSRVVSEWRTAVRERSDRHKERVVREKERLADTETLAEIANSLSFFSLTLFTPTHIELRLTLTPHAHCTLRFTVSERSEPKLYYAVVDAEVDLELQSMCENDSVSGASAIDRERERESEHSLVAAFFAHLLASDERRGPLSSAQLSSLSDISQIAPVLEKTMGYVVLLRATIQSLRPLLSHGGRYLLTAQRADLVLHLFKPQSSTPSLSVSLFALLAIVQQQHSNEENTNEKFAPNEFTQFIRSLC